MADTVRGPIVSRPLAFAKEERRTVHSWSRISSAGHNVLLDALKILSPMSRDLSSSEDLVTFLQELRDEGHRPTVLRSKDVYGYRSCTTQPLTLDKLKPTSRNVRPTAKKRARRPKKRDVHPSWNISGKSNPRIHGIPPPELLMDHRAFLCSRTAGRTAVRSQSMQVRPCLRLTNIEGSSGFHTARLQIHTSWDSATEVPTVTFSQQQQHPPTLSGIPLQPSQNGGGAPTRAVALFSQKSLSCPIRSDGALIGDSAPVFYANGRAFPETHTELTSNGWRSNGLHRDARSPKEMNYPTRQRNGWKDKRGFRRKVIKVDDSRSVADARRKAQKILQVNLSPVIQIQPLQHLLRNFRYQTK